MNNATRFIIGLGIFFLFLLIAPIILLIASPFAIAGGLILSAISAIGGVLFGLLTIIAGIYYFVRKVPEPANKSTSFSIDQGKEAGTKKEEDPDQPTK